MNGKERSDIKTVLQLIEDGNKERGKLMKKVDQIHICLTGDPEDHTDLGMQGAVNDNTHFRKTAKYWLGALGITSLTVLAKSFWKSIFPS